MDVGDRVNKKEGYKWPGVIVSKFKTLAGKDRYVVECVAGEVQGALHIFNEKQLELINIKHEEG